MVKGRPRLHPPMQRRSFLAAAGAGSFAALAGCQTAVGSVAPPRVPEDTLSAGGWTKTEETTDRTVFEEEMGPVTVEAVASSVDYEKTALAERVREDTLGAVEGTIAMFSATRIDLAPSVDELGPVAGEVETRIEANAREELRTTLEDAGLSPIERAGTGTLPLASGAEAALTEYTAVYRVEDMTFPLQGGESVTIEGTDLPIEALLAVWAAEGNYLVAGGAYPAANVVDTTETEISDAISVAIEIDLGLEPEAYRDELLELVTGVR